MRTSVRSKTYPVIFLKLYWCQLYFGVCVLISVIYSSLPTIIGGALNEECQRQNIPPSDSNETDRNTSSA